MSTLKFTKLNEKDVKEVVVALEQLLADFQVYYTNLRGFHWNVKGPDFFVLHSQMEKMYDEVAEKIDEIAERILMLGGTPTAKFSDYLKIAKVKEEGVVCCGEKILENVLNTTSYFIEAERNILSLASEAGDEATVAMMGDYISEQEKLVWMLVARASK